MADAANSISRLETSLEALHEASFGWARSCCVGNPDDAADVLQTAYVKVLSGAARFEGRSAFKTWLFGVIRLTALERRRTGGRELSLSEFEVEETAPSTPADVALIEQEEGAALRLALTQLPPRQQDVLHLVFYQGMSIAEAAVVMEVSIGSARTHYERGKKRLRAILAPALRDEATHALQDEDAAPGTGAGP